MKPVLPALLAAVVWPFLPVAVAEPSTPTTATSARSSKDDCSRCDHAPCRCGFSPSYYTHYRKPVSRGGKHHPVTPHWTRPVPGTPSTTFDPSPRRARVVPAPTPRQTYGSSHGYSPSRNWWYHSRPGHYPQSIVPTPRRPRVVPSVTPRVRLGYLPHGSWAYRYSGRSSGRCR